MSPLEGVTIRQARPPDQANLEELWDAFVEEQSHLEASLRWAEDASARWRNDMKEWIKTPFRHILVAEGDDRLVGFGQAELSESSPMSDEGMVVLLNEIYVDPDYRRAGLASRMVSEISEWAVQKGAAYISLNALERNPAGRTFWESLGARPMYITFRIDP